MRVLVCGGRDYTDRARVYAELDVEEARTDTGIVPVYSGMARGADMVRRARAAGVPIREVV